MSGESEIGWEWVARELRIGCQPNVEGPMSVSGGNDMIWVCVLEQCPAAVGNLGWAHGESVPFSLPAAAALAVSCSLEL